MSDPNEEAPEFYMLECFAPPGEKRMDIRAYPRVNGVASWLAGARFSGPIEQPIRLEWDPKTEGPRKTLYDVTIPLFHKDLVAALREAGIDNLDCYGTEIRHPKEGVTTRDYLAVNIIGLIAAADLEQSQHTAYSPAKLIDVDFDSLVIDPKRTLGARLFRLAECVTGLVIHRSVKDFLHAKGGFGLTFVSPKEWIG